MKFIKQFSDLSFEDISLVGGKNAALGQMIKNLSNKVLIPDGFAITVDAYWYFLKYNDLLDPIKKEMAKLTDYKNVKLLNKIASNIREMITEKPFPEDLIKEIEAAYKGLSARYKQKTVDVAIRSSATAEDLPHASFAGQQETYLNIQGLEEVTEFTKRCMASLFTERAIAYRIQQKFNHFKVGISVGIQKMVRSDKASSGVIFSLDTESGFKNIIIINSSYGLGENIVQGLVNPDEFHIAKSTLELGFKPIIKKYLGNKKTKLIYSSRSKNSVKSISVPNKDQRIFSLNDEEILELARLALTIEKYYSQVQGSWVPVDIEWAKDGIDKKLYIVQARPETVHSHELKLGTLTDYILEKPEHNEILVTGQSIGKRIGNGIARVINNIHDFTKFDQGDILVTPMTDPDWVPLMKKAAAIVTDQGGRTCHAAIVSRELGIPAIVGTNNGTGIIKEGDKITIDCSGGSTGNVYKGIINYKIINVELKSIPKPPVPVLVNIANPDKAYELSFLPVSGVGLARVEFIISNTIQIHPMAIACPERITDKKIKAEIDKLSHAYGSPESFFVETLAQGIGRIAASFYPNEVIVRLSDFKSNEYRDLLGGKYFEPLEENPMLGFRGAIRYCSESYSSAFALECAAFNKARNEMGFKNIKLMIPFIRTINEAKCTIEALEKHDIKRGHDKLEIIMMCEIPSNVLLLKEFSSYFDGFSIGSNDLTQLTLGVDRDSGYLTSIFNECDPAVQKLISMAIKSAKEANKPIGICGQAPSDFPEIAELLIKEGISYLSLNADSVIPFLIRFKKQT